MGVQVAVGEIAGGGELVDGRGVQVGGLLGDGTGTADPLRRTQPAQPQPGRHDLGEAAQQHRPVLRARVGGDPRHPLALVPQFAVRVVLDDPQSAPRGDLGDGGPAGGGEGAAGGVLERRHGVEQLGPLADHQFLQRRRVQAVFVAGHRDDPRPGQPEGLKRRQIAGVFDQHRVARFEQRRGEEGQRLLGAGGDEQVVGRGHQPARAGAFGEYGPQRGFALGRGVLQRPRGRLGEHRAVRLSDPVRVEQFRRRETAREVDHLGAGGDGQDVPHGRAADR